MFDQAAYPLLAHPTAEAVQAMLSLRQCPPSSQLSAYPAGLSTPFYMQNQQFFADAQGGNGTAHVLTPPGSPEDKKGVLTGYPPVQEASPHGSSPASASTMVSPPKDMGASLCGESSAFNEPVNQPVNFSPLVMSDDPSFLSPAKRPCRSQKKCIPPDQKDAKYFERRAKNNVAAKKSRDNRKMREQDIQMRASLLERDNSYLRAQVQTLREEAAKLRQMLLHKQQMQQLQAAAELEQPIDVSGLV